MVRQEGGQHPGFTDFELFGNWMIRNPRSIQSAISRLNYQRG